MKKTIKLVAVSFAYVCLLVAGLVHSPRTAQANYNWSANIGAGPRNWTSVNTSQDGSKIVLTTMQTSPASSGNGYIYTSDNGGSTWIARTNAGLRAWGPATMSADGTKIAAFAYYGFMYTSADSGQTWTEQTSAGRQEPWVDVAMSRDGNTIVGSSPQGLIISNDGGANWRIESPDISRDLKLSVSADGSKIAAVSSAGYIYISRDGGYNWTTYFGDARRFWRNIKISADGMKIVAVQAWDYVYTSNDGGASWTRQTSAGQRNWYAVSASDDGSKIIASAADYVYVSTDSGVTWSEEPNQGGVYWYDVSASGNGNKLFGIKQGGYLYSAGAAVVLAPVTVTGQNTSLGSANLVNNVMVSYPVTFSFSINAGDSTIYVSSNPQTAFDTTNSGYTLNPNSYTSLNSMSVSPSNFAGDSSAAYVIPAGTSRLFTVRGTILAEPQQYGTRSLHISAINYGSSIANLRATAINQSPSDLIAYASFGIRAIPGRTVIETAPIELTPTPYVPPTPITPVEPPVKREIQYEWNLFMQQYQPVSMNILQTEDSLTAAIWAAIGRYFASQGQQ